MTGTIIQKTLATKLTFDFRKDNLGYTLKDLSGEIEISPRYEAILAQQPYSFLVKDKPLMGLSRKVAIALLVASIALTFVHSDIAVPAALGCLMASVFLLILSARGVKCTMLKMEPVPPGAGKLHIRIMQDDNHDQILGEIRTRWRERLRFLHLNVNTANPSDQEVAKFRWMFENDVISDREYQGAIREIQLEASSNSEARPVFN